MSLIPHIAKHFREVYFGGNWTWSNLTDVLAGITCAQANTKMHSFNTIVALTYHIHYYVQATIPVLEGGALNAHDKFAYDHPAVETEADWEALKATVFSDGHKLSALIEQLPETRLWDTMTDEKYGNYYRNLQGIIEHTHYHLGQIALLKKLV